MSQTFFVRCTIIFALLILLIAALTGCTPETAVSSTSSPNSPEPTQIPVTREQYNEPLVGELSFEERPSPTDLDTPTINLILINAAINADNEDVAIDGRGLETPLRHLNHCSSIVYDGEQIIIAGRQLSSLAANVVLMEYTGISLSTGGDNTRENVLNNDVTEYSVPLALDTDFTFYTIDLGDSYTLNLWQGEQNGNQVSTSYKRPFEDKLGHATLSERHEITILRNVPITYRDPIECD